MTKRNAAAAIICLMAAGMNPASAASMDGQEVRPACHYGTTGANAGSGIGGLVGGAIGATAATSLTGLWCSTVTFFDAGVTCMLLLGTGAILGGVAGGEFGYGAGEAFCDNPS